MHGTEAPSDWVRRWLPLAPPGSTVLDVACGAGRHLRWMHEHGHPTVGVDRSADAVAACAAWGEIHSADIEAGPWPFMVGSVAPGGVLIYETFASGNATVGRPARADFLLQPGELLTACAALRTVAYEDGFLDLPARFVQRIAAVREPAHPGQPVRYRLTTPV